MEDCLSVLALAKTNHFSDLHQLWYQSCLFFVHEDLHCVAQTSASVAYWSAVLSVESEDRRHLTLPYCSSPTLVTGRCLQMKMYAQRCCSQHQMKTDVGRGQERMSLDWYLTDCLWIYWHDAQCLKQKPVFTNSELTTTSMMSVMWLFDRIKPSLDQNTTNQMSYYTINLVVHAKSSTLCPKNLPPFYFLNN